MTQIHGPVQITINASPETIYNYLLDFQNHVAWNHQLVRVTQITPDPIQVGTVFEALEQAPKSIPEWLRPIIMNMLRLVGAGPPQTRSEITQLIPNEHIEWLAQSPIKGKPDMQMKWQLHFAPQGEATLVSQQFQMFPYNPIAKMMSGPRLQAQILAGCQENLGKLKAIIENL